MGEISETGLAEILFIPVLVSILISGFTGLLLAQLGLFSLFSLLFLILCACIIILVTLRQTQDIFFLPGLRLNRTTIFLIVILIIAVALFFHPYPWIVGGRDPGVYVNTGINIANTGKIIVHDPFLAGMDSDAQKLFYQIETRPDILSTIKYEGTQFPGFYITNAQNGEITPQFFYLWPLWIAIFYAIFGLEGALYCTPVFAILALVSVYCTGKFLYNNLAGLIASLILVLNFAQIWYARYPTSEIFTMFIIFSGILTFLFFMKSKSPVFGCLAAVCFGELLLTRIDAFLIVIPPLTLVIGSGILGKFKKEHYAFLVPFSILSSYALILAFVVSAPYTFDVFKILQGRSILPDTMVFFLGLFVVMLFIIIISMALLKKKFSDMLKKILIIFHNLKNSERFIFYLSLFFSVILMIYVIYNYFIRPSGNVDSDSFNLVKLSWYTAGLIGISATVLGILVLVRKKTLGYQLFFLSVFGIFAVYQLLSSNIYPDQPWWARRYLPVVIPSMIICMGCCIAWLCSHNLFDGKYLVLRRGTACILLLLILLPQGISDSTIVFYSEYHDAIGEISNISQKFDDNAIIVFKNNYYTDKIATPLYYIYHKTIVKNTPSSASLSTMLNWTESGATVYLIDAIENNDILESHGVEKFTYDIHWTTFNGMSLQGMSFDNFYNYILIPHRPLEEEHTFNILIFNKTHSIENMFFFGNNWYSREYRNGIPMRWLSNNGTLLCYSDQNRIVNMTFVTLSFYQPRSLQIYSGETLQSQQTLPPSFTEISVKIPLKTGENSIRLFVPEGCKRPSEIPELHSRDTRCLSIAFHNMTIS